MKVRSERRDAAAASLSSACSFCSFLLAWAAANSTSYLTSRAAACSVSTRGRSSPCKEDRRDVARRVDPVSRSVKLSVSNKERRTRPFGDLDDGLAAADGCGVEGTKGALQPDRVRKQKSVFSEARGPFPKVHQGFGHVLVVGCFVYHETHGKLDRAPDQSGNLRIGRHKRVDNPGELLEGLKERVQTSCNRGASFLGIHPIQRGSEDQDRVGIWSRLDLNEVEPLLIAERALEILDCISQDFRGVWRWTRHGDRGEGTLSDSCLRESGAAGHKCASTRGWHPCALDR